MMFAIRNKRSKRWLYGTDFRYHPPHQRTDTDRVMIFPTWEIARLETIWRSCGKDYEIVAVKIEEVNEE